MTKLTSDRAVVPRTGKRPRQLRTKPAPVTSNMPTTASRPPTCCNIELPASGVCDTCGN